VRPDLSQWEVKKSRGLIVDSGSYAVLRSTLAW
jgi:hypothetical protein